MEKPEVKEAAVFTFGRMNPPTSGHAKLINHVKQLARHHGANHYVFVSGTHDNKKNPLTHRDKVHFIQSMLPGTNVHPGAEIKTPLDAMKHLQKMGHKRVTMVVGEDRVKSFHNLLHKYNGHEYTFDNIHVVSAGHRDPDSEGVEGMSASKMREHAQKGDFESFRKGVPSKQHAKELYMATRKGLKAEQYTALFLIGGPGSGKDALLRETVLNDESLVEINLEKLYKAINEQKNVAEVNQGEPLIVNGNADDFKKITLTKKVLETVGYRTAGVYVYTTDEVSQARNEQRIKLGAKTITEEVRLEKYTRSLYNAKVLNDEFNLFTIFDNSSPLRTEQTQLWFDELNDLITGFYTGQKSINETVAEFLNETPGTSVSTNTTSQPTPKNPNQKNNKSSRFVRDTKTGRLRTNASTIQVPYAPKVIATGPHDPSSTGASRLKEETGFKKFRKTKVTKLPGTAIPGNSTFHADIGAGITSTSEATLWKTSNQNKPSGVTPVKAPSTLGTIRPSDSVGGAFAAQGANGTNPLAATPGTANVKYKPRKAAKAPATHTDARQGDDMAGVGTIGEGHGVFAQWAAENKANKQKSREQDRLEKLAKRTKHKEFKTHIADVQKEHNRLAHEVSKAEGHGRQAEYEEAIAAVHSHHEKHKNIWHHIKPKVWWMDEAVKPGKPKKAVKTFRTSSVKADGSNQGISTTMSMNSEEKSFKDFRQDYSLKSPDLSYTTPEVYEDWGVEGEETIYEGRVIKTNKPFRSNKQYNVYVKDGDNVTCLKFERKGAITLQEGLKPTDIKFWETK